MVPEPVLLNFRIKSQRFYTVLYDKFIAAGRRIRCGQKPDGINVDEPKDQIESVIANLTHYVMQQKDIEKQLADSEQKFQDICLTTKDIIFELNENMIFIYLSDNCSETIGCCREELLHKTPFDFLDETEAAILKSHMENSISNNLILDCDLKVWQEGELKYRHISAKPVFTPDGKFKGFRGTYRDVTEKTKMKEKIEEHIWLIESIIESVEHVGIVLTDLNDSVLKWNKYFQKLLDYPPHDILATKSLRRYYQYLEAKLSDPVGFKKSFEEMKNSSEKTTHFINFKDGRKIKETVYPLFRNGLLFGRMAQLTDITERRH
jgi:hypothetical protein